MAAGGVVGGKGVTATVIVGWPLDDSKEDARYTFDAGTNLADALMIVSPDRWGGMSFTLFYGTVSAETELPVADAADHVLAEGEVWHVAVCPADPVTGAIIVGVATATGSKMLGMVVAYAAMTAISMAVSFAASMLLAPGKQGDRPIAPSDQPTGLNALSPPRNTIRAAGRIPEIYGRMRHWPDLLFPAWQSWEVINNDAIPNWSTMGPASTGTTSQQDVYGVFCVGRGHLSVSNPRFGDTDIGAIHGDLWWYGPGSTLPDWVRLPRPVANLSRVEFPSIKEPNAWLPWMRIPGDAVSEIWFQVTAPGGLYLAAYGKGVTPGANYLSTHAVFLAQFDRMDAGGMVIEHFEHAFTMEGRTQNELRHTFKINVTPGRWKVRIAEVATHEPPTTNATRRTALEGIVGFERISDAHRTYSDETVVIIHARNRGGTAIQNLEQFNCIVQRVLPLPDAIGNLGMPSGNSFWITAAAHTLLDAHACAYEPSQVDWPSLHEVQAALTASGEQEFNGTLDRQTSADEQLQMVARKARAQVFISGGLVTFARDQRRPGVSALFNRRNRLATRGSTGLGLRLPGPDDHDAVEIQWVDAANDWKQRTFTWPEGITPKNALRIDLTGATHWHEVWRRARYEYALLRYRRRTQPLRVTEEAELLLPFDRVAVVHPWEEGVTDGEVLDVSWPFLRLDRPVPPLGMTPGAARAGLPPLLSPPDVAPRAMSFGIRLRAADGRDTRLLPFVPAPQRGDDWIEMQASPGFTIVAPGPDRQLGTLFNISTHDAADRATHWLVSGAEIDEAGVTLSLMADDDRVYAEADDPAVPASPPLMETY
jgi:hypothetical protein